jgi:hypothetical protein
MNFDLSLSMLDLSMESMKCEVVKAQIPTVEVSNRQLFMKSAKVTSNSSVGRRVHFVLSMYICRACNG